MKNKVFTPKVFTSSNERGSTLLEFFVTLLVLPSLFIWVVDYSRLIINYMVVTQIVREGTRFVSAIAELEAGQYPDNFRVQADLLACRPPTPDPALPCGHIIAQQRVFYLLSLHGHNIDPDSIGITSEFIPLGIAASGIRQDAVRITFTANYQGLFLGNLPMTASSTAPYLLETSI